MWPSGLPLPRLRFVVYLEFAGAPVLRAAPRNPKPMPSSWRARICRSKPTLRLQLLARGGRHNYGGSGRNIFIDISALATSLALALDSGARPEALGAPAEFEVDNEAAVGATAGPLGHIMNPTRTNAPTPARWPR